MITFIHIYKSYNGKEITSDPSLTIESGTFLTIIGLSPIHIFEPTRH